MEAAVARDKHACPACGGDAHWNPAKQALVCPYCGTTAPASLDAASGLIVEHDLASALRSVPEEGRGWRAEKHSVKCRSCQAISVIDASRVGQRCDFCGAAQLIPYEQTKAPISPESVLVFKLSEPQVREAIRAWYGSHWLAPGKLKSRAMTDVVKGLYIPYWTFDAHADASWTAESGYYYYEMEQYRGPDGKTLTRRVQRVRWEPSAGHLQHFFDDELVPGTKGVHEKLLRQVEPFPTQDLVGYDPGFVAGWVVEQYQVDLTAAAVKSRSAMDEHLRGMCAQQVPGDTHRNLRVQANYSAQTFKHVLVPVWLLTYTYGTRTFQVVLNGYTGAIAGEYPKSWVKILFLILGAAAIILIAIALSQN